MSVDPRRAVFAEHGVRDEARTLEDGERLGAVEAEDGHAVPGLLARQEFGTQIDRRGDIDEDMLVADPFQSSHF